MIIANKTPYLNLSNIEFNGGNIGDVKIVASMDDCYFLCLDTSGCVGFTYENVSHSCFVKDGNWTLTLKANHLSGVVRGNFENVA